MLNPTFTLVLRTAALRARRATLVYADNRILGHREDLPPPYPHSKEFHQTLALGDALLPIGELNEQFQVIVEFDNDVRLYDVMHMIYGVERVAAIGKIVRFNNIILEIGNDRRLHSAVDLISWGPN